MDTSPSNPANHAALLQELALRLTTSPGDPRTRNPQLFVARLPDNLPFAVPIPPGSRIIGSLARSVAHIDIVLDAPLPPEQALAFYKEQLLAAGWSEPEQPMGMAQRGGFVHSHMQALSHSALFCQGPRGPSLHFMALMARDGVTEVRLNLNLDERESPCRQSARMRRERHMGFDQLIPPLVPPEGAQQTGGGGGGGSDSWYSSATLEADSDLAALGAHYAGHLEKAGWSRVDGGVNGPVAWHTWTLKDEDGEPWDGFFFIHQLPGKPRDYFLYIRIESSNSGGGWRSGGFSSSTMSGSWLSSSSSGG